MLIWLLTYFLPFFLIPPPGAGKVMLVYLLMSEQEILAALFAVCRGMKTVVVWLVPYRLPRGSSSLGFSDRPKFQRFNSVDI